MGVTKMIEKLHMFMNQALPATYDDALSYYEALSRAIDRLNTTIDIVNSDHTILENAVSEITGINQSIRQIQSEIDTIDTDLTNLESKLNTLSSQVESLNTTVSSISGNVSALTDRIAVVESNLTQLDTYTRETVAPNANTALQETTDINNKLDTGFTTPYINLRTAVTSSTAGNRAATVQFVKDYAGSLTGGGFDPITLSKEVNSILTVQLQVDMSGWHLTYTFNSSSPWGSSGTTTIWQSSDLGSALQTWQTWLKRTSALNSTIIMPIFTGGSGGDSVTMNASFNFLWSDFTLSINCNSGTARTTANGTITFLP